MRTYRFDIFIQGRYITTLTTKAPQQWVFGENELVSLVESRFPSLVGKGWAFA